MEFLTKPRFVPDEFPEELEPLVIDLIEAFGEEDYVATLKSIIEKAYKSGVKDGLSLAEWIKKG